MAEVYSFEVYEVEIKELDDGMFWPELGGIVPEKKVFSAVSSTPSSCSKNTQDVLTLLIQDRKELSGYLYDTSVYFLPR